MDELTFEETDGMCPWCLNEHREGVAYTVKWHYDKHLEVCKVRLAEEVFPEETEELDEGNNEPEVIVEEIVEVEEQIECPEVLDYMVVTDDGQVMYHGKNIEMALRIIDELWNQGTKATIQEV